MAHSYATGIGTKEQFLDFLKKRFARLYPLHILTMLVYVVLFVLSIVSASALKMILGHPLGSSNIFEKVSNFLTDRTYAVFINIFLVQGMHTAKEMSLNFPSWSISVEFWTYIVFGSVFLHFQSTKFRIVVALTISMCAFFGLYAFGYRNDLGYMQDFGFIRCLGGFFLGCCIPLVLRNKKSLTPSLGLNLALLLSLLLLIFTFVYASQFPRITFLCPIAAAILIATCYSDSAYFAKWLGSPLLVKLGALSFGVYMWHVPLLVFIKPIKALLPNEFAIWFLCFVFTLALLLISQISLKFFETPCRKRISSL
jgi:peptidoglycan/LPS O-acetylase OafA/YrhL